MRPSANIRVLNVGASPYAIRKKVPRALAQVRLALRQALISHRQKKHGQQQFASLAR